MPSSEGARASMKCAEAHGRALGGAGASGMSSSSTLYSKQKT